MTEKRWQIVIVPDSFKGSLDAMEVAKAMEEGVKKAFQQVNTLLLPMADGGEGTVDAILRTLGGNKITIKVTDPLGKPVESYYGLLTDKKTAVIEMAAASGLPLVPLDKRDPRITTTYGTGELIKDAVLKGAKKLILGIGGSATNDGGAGMAQALGIKLLSVEGNDIPVGGAALSVLDKIDISGLLPEIKDVEIIVACDVNNPLVGPQGATAVFGPQKGATSQMVTELDACLLQLAQVMKHDLARDITKIPGAGAAGGLGGGLLGFLGARLESGFNLLANLFKLEEHISEADLVITGEGRIDATSTNGKVLSGVGQIASKYKVPVLAIGGSIGEGAELLYNMGISGIYPATCQPVTLKEAMSNARTNIIASTRNACEIYKSGFISR